MDWLVQVSLTLFAFTPSTSLALPVNAKNVRLTCTSQPTESSTAKLEIRTQHKSTVLSNGTTTNITECVYSPGNYSGSSAFWAGCASPGKCGTETDMINCLQIPTNCGGRPFRMNSGYQSGRLHSNGIDTILHYMKESPCSNATLQLDTLGGKINDMESNHTAFPHRTNTLTYQFITYFDYDCHEYKMVPWLDNFYI